MKTKLCCECLAPLGAGAKNDKCLLCQFGGGAKGIVIYALFVIAVILGLIWFGGGWQ
jgi:hypothetical protein